MATVVLRPNGTNDDGNWEIGGGAATLHAATSDDSDTTYATAPNATGQLILDFGTSSLPAGSQIRSVRFRIRDSQPAGTELVLVRQKVGADTEEVTFFQPDAAIITHTLPAVTHAPDLTAWLQADIDSLQIELVGGYGAGDTDDVRIYEVYADVLYNEIPVVAVTGPADEDGGAAGVQVVNNSRPPITWTFTDPEDDVEERWEVRVYAEPGGGWAGFDPDTTIDTPAAQSGVVLSSVLSWTPTADLPNSATYRAYVRAADAGSAGRYSAWAYREFTMDLDPPPAPTVATTVELATARVKLDVTVPAGGQAASFVVVEYSDDAGATWAVVRDASRFAYAGPNGATVTVYDYEAPPSKQRSYRAKSGRVSGNDVVSDPGATANATVSITVPWLKVPTNSALNISVNTRERAPVERAEAQSVHWPIGRSDAVVVSSGRRAAVSSLTVWRATLAQREALEAIIDARSVCLLQFPSEESGQPGEQWYLRFRSSSERRVTRVAGVARDVVLPWVEVRSP